MTEENTNDVRQRKLNIKAIIGELLIFLIFGVMVYFYYKSKDEDKIKLLVSAIILFIYLQIILIGLLYTYYYEIKKNSNANNLTYNVTRGGNFYLIIIGILLILTCYLMYKKYIIYIILMMISLIFLYVYIKTYREFIDYKPSTYNYDMTTYT